VTGRSGSRSRGTRTGPRVLALAAGAALLACGVKAPPRPPEKAGVAGPKHDLRVPEAPDGGAEGGDAADGGAGRP